MNRQKITESGVFSIEKIHQLHPNVSTDLDAVLEAKLKNKHEDRLDVNDLITAFEERISIVRLPLIPVAQAY